MSNFKYSVVSLLSVLVLVGCVSEAPQQDMAYVSPTIYQDYNCKQLRAERQRLSAKLEQATQSNNTNQILGAAVTAFAISQNYVVSDDRDDTELRRYQNQYDVLEQAAIQKECR